MDQFTNTDVLADAARRSSISEWNPTWFSANNMTFNSTAVTSFENDDSNSGFSTDGCIEIPSAVGFAPCNNPADLISVSTRQIFERVINVFILPMFCVVGVATNVINCTVFYTQGLRDRINMCLFSLALADMIYILSLNMRYFGQVLAALTGTDFNQTWVTFLVRYRLVAVHGGIAMVSNLITITIGLERCVCVVNPLRAARLLRTRFLATVLAVFSVPVLAGMQFVAFKFDVVCAIIARSGGNSTGRMAGFKSNSNSTNSTDGPGYNSVSKKYTLIIPSKLYLDNTLLMDVLDTFVFTSVVPVISLLVIVVATSITVIKLKTAASWRMAATAATLHSLQATTNKTTINQKEVSLTRMLVVISCVYIACVSPGVLRSLARFLFTEFQPWGRLCNVVLVAEGIQNVLLALNSTVNFFVYYAMGSKFNDTLRRLLRCRPKETSQRRSGFFFDCHLKLMNLRYTDQESSQAMT